MEYENLFNNMDEIEKVEVDKNIEQYKKDGAIPMLSRLGNIKRCYISYGKEHGVNGEQLFNDDLSVYVNSQN